MFKKNKIFINYKNGGPKSPISEDIGEGIMETPSPIFSSERREHLDNRIADHQIHSHHYCAEHKPV